MKSLSKDIQKFIDSLKANAAEQAKKPWGEREMMPIPTEPQLVVSCLIDVFLGEDWYVVDPISTKQVNTLALDEILYKHCKAYRKEVKRQQKGERR